MCKPGRSRAILARLGITLALFFLFGAGVCAEPIAIEKLFAKYPYREATLSPNGQFLAVALERNGRYNAGVIDLATQKVTHLTNFDKSDVIQITWQNDTRLIIRIGDLRNGLGEADTQYGLAAISRDASDVRQIQRSFGPSRAASVRLLQIIPNTNEVLLVAQERTIHSTDVYRFDTLTGKKTLLTYDSPGDVWYWVADYDGVPRAALTGDLDHDKSALYVRNSATDPWRKIEEAGLGRLTTTPVGFSPDGRTLYLEARGDSDLVGLYEYDIASDKRTGPTVRLPDRDINATFVRNLRDRKLYGMRYDDDTPSAIWFDAEWAKMQKSVDAALPGTVNRLQKSDDRWLVIASSDRNPGEVYLLDAKSMKMEKVFSYAPTIDPSRMSPMKWVRYKARDGMTIPALLTVPKGAEGKAVPLIVDIHGGPNVPAEVWRFQREVQFLASRGYAVLQPQFRGTEGFGWKFESAGFRKWGDEMQDDLEDGALWAVAQGIADPDKICFYGASYGGYAAMWGAIKNAKVIKCAVAYAGVSSIDYMFDNAQTDMSQLAEKSTLMMERIGDPKAERDRFKRVNPLDNAERVGVPIFLAYGALDVRVPIVHGTAFKAALDKYNKPYEWVVYNDEAHGFQRDDHLFDFYHRIEKFLAKYLGSPSAVANLN